MKMRPRSFGKSGRGFAKIGGMLAILSLGFAAQIANAAEATTATPATADSPDTLVMVVMDPLALPLSCPCVQGYAQRNYDKFGEKLQRELGRPVKVVYSESFTKALKEGARGRADIVIGKHSVVRFDAAKADLKVTPIARLSGKDGATMQTGLIVVPKDDPAHSVSDLAGYRIVFGPEECDEKHTAAIALLKDNGVKVPEKLETSPACSDGACNILDEFKKDSTSHGTALISSYAKPLLEGCGTVEKGALRVVGETKPVPFVEAFITEQVKPAERAEIAAAVMKSTTDPLVQLALETRDGFVPIDNQAAKDHSAAPTLQVTPRIIISSDGSEENLLDSSAAGDESAKKK